MNDALQSSLQRYHDALQGKFQAPKPAAAPAAAASIDLLGDPSLATAPPAADPFGFSSTPAHAPTPAPVAASAPAPFVEQDPLDVFLSGREVPASKPISAPAHAVKVAPPSSDFNSVGRRRSRTGKNDKDLLDMSASLASPPATNTAAAAPPDDDPFAALDAIASRHSSVPGTTFGASARAAPLDFFSVQPMATSRPVAAPPANYGMPFNLAPQPQPQPQYQPQPMVAQPSANPFDDLLGLSNPQPQTQHPPANYYSQPRTSGF